MGFIPLPLGREGGHERCLIAAWLVTGVPRRTRIRCSWLSGLWRRTGGTAELDLLPNHGVILGRVRGLSDWGLIHSSRGLQLVLLMNQKMPSRSHSHLLGTPFSHLTGLKGQVFLVPVMQISR